MSAGHSQLLTRQNLIVANVVLVLILAASLAFSFWYFSARGTIVRGGEVTAGIRPVLAVSGPGRGQYPAFVRPMGVAFGPDGGLHVLDTGNDRVVVLTPEGRFESEFGGFGALAPPAGLEPSWSEGLMNNPVGIDVDDSGLTYVADLRNRQVQVFDSEGGFLRRFPDPSDVIGTGASAQEATGVAAVDVAVSGELVFVAEANRIVVFTREGQFVNEIDQAASGSIEFDDITGIDAGQDGLLYIADAGATRVLALTAEGDLVWSVGASRKPDAQPPAVAPASPYEFALPRDIAVTAGGSVAVLDSAESSIVLFSRDGAFLSRHGSGGSAPGVFMGANTIDARGDLLLVADTGNGRIQVVQLVR